MVFVSVRQWLRTIHSPNDVGCSNDGKEFFVVFFAAVDTGEKCLELAVSLGYKPLGPVDEYERIMPGAEDNRWTRHDREMSYTRRGLFSTKMPTVCAWPET
jgi:hypothetical protein